MTVPAPSIGCPETGIGTVALPLCRLAAQSLGWRPQEFWAATPAELATALGLVGQTGSAAEGFDPATLRRLMENDHER